MLCSTDLYTHYLSHELSLHKLLVVELVAIFSEYSGVRRFMTYCLVSKSPYCRRSDHIRIYFWCDSANEYNFIQVKATEQVCTLIAFFMWFCFWLLRNMVTFLRWGVVSNSPSPKLEDHLLLAVRDCLFNIFAATLHIWRPFLHPQPEDAPCRRDRDPLTTVADFY